MIPSAPYFFFMPQLWNFIMTTGFSIIVSVPDQITWQNVVLAIPILRHNRPFQMGFCTHLAFPTSYTTEELLNLATVDAYENADWNLDHKDKIRFNLIDTGEKDYDEDQQGFNMLSKIIGDTATVITDALAPLLDAIRGTVQQRHQPYNISKLIADGQATLVDAPLSMCHVLYLESIKVRSNGRIAFRFMLYTIPSINHKVEEEVFAKC